MVKKLNGSAPEVVHADDHPGPSDEVIAAFESGKDTDLGERRVEPADPAAFEAGMLRPRDGCEMIYFGVVKRPGVVEWNTIGVRFDRRRVGSAEFIFARPTAAPLTARGLVALERAHGRDGLQYHLQAEPLVAEAVTLEGVAFLRLPSGSRVVHVKIRGLWFAVLTLLRRHKFEPAPVPPPGGGEAFPKIAIA